MILGKFIDRFRKIRREEGSLVKNFYLTPKDVAYRLALENAGYDSKNIPLPAWYESLKSTKSSRDKYFLANAVSFFGLILANFGALQGIEYNGVEIDKKFILPSLFAFYSTSILFYSYFQSKVRRYEEVFHSIYEKSSHAEKFDLLLRYPESFNALQFNPFIAGNPKHMLPARDYPIRLIFIIILTLSISIPWLLMTFWLIIQSTISIYSITIPSWSWFGLAVNIASWSALIGSSLLTTSNFRRKYIHYGMVSLLQKARPNEKRHGEMIRRINKVRYPKL